MAGYTWSASKELEATVDKKIKNEFSDENANYYRNRIKSTWDKNTSPERVKSFSDISDPTSPTLQNEIPSVPINSFKGSSVLSLVGTKNEKYLELLEDIHTSPFPTVKQCDDCLKECQTILEKKELIEIMRMKLLNYYHPVCHSFKKVMWIIIIIWCVGCALGIVLLGLQFDTQYYVETTYLRNIYGECYNLYEISNITTQLASKQADNLNHRTVFSDDFGTASQQSYRWVTGICFSIALSLLVWQPLMTWLYTWVSIWAFHHSKPLEMIFAHQVYMLFYYLCCCCSFIDTWCQKTGDLDFLISQEKDIHATDILSSDSLYSMSSFTEKSIATVKLDDRYIDQHIFLGRDKYFIDLSDEEKIRKALESIQDILPDDDLAKDRRSTSIRQVKRIISNLSLHLPRVHSDDDHENKASGEKAKINGPQVVSLTTMFEKGSKQGGSSSETIISTNESKFYGNNIDQEEFV